MNLEGFVAGLLTILSGLKESLLELMPNLLGALLLLLTGLLVAYLARVLAIYLLNRVYILIPKPSIRTRVKGFIQDKPVSRVIGGIFFWLFFFLFLTAATETLGLPFVSAWLSVVTGFIPKILSASLIGVAGVLAGAILRDLVVAGTVSAGILYGRLLGQLTMAIVILVAAFVAFDQIGIDISFLQNVFVVGMAALLLGAALAFGLGSRTSVANILASYYLQRTYHVGDQIEIGERKGKIIEIGPVAVILDSPDGRICIPAREFSRRSSVLLSNE